MKYTNLFKKGKIGNLELKNRTVMPGISCFLKEEDLISFYEKRARAGCGLIITGMARIDDETGIVSKNQLRAVKLDDISNLEKLVNRVHKYNTKVFLQLSHPGRQTKKSLLNGKNTISASEIIFNETGEVPDKMSLRQIQVLISRFAIAAKIAKDSGMDGIEIDAAHGNLISQFISPYTNKRNDKYGGNIYSNLNLLKEIIDGIRQFCTDEYPISVRVNALDYIDGGLSKEDALETIKIISTFPIDIINLGFGTYESKDYMVESLDFKEGWKMDLIKNIKENINIPLISTNNIKTAEVAEYMLKNNIVDYVGLGRSQIADEKFIEKSLNNREIDINRCISCLNCRDRFFEGLSIECSVNKNI